MAISELNHDCIKATNAESDFSFVNPEPQRADLNSFGPTRVSVGSFLVKYDHHNGSGEYHGGRLHLDIIAVDCQVLVTTHW